MRWLDVTGIPGVGKSTICDPLWHSQRRFDDGLLPPASWQPFIDEMTKLFVLIRGHWSFVPAVRMNQRSGRKMSTIARMEGDEPYIQTGWLQRVLGFGWRLNDMGADVNLIRPALETMPVSLGVAFLTARPETIEARNRARLENPATRHENRAFMVPLMQKPLEIAREALTARGVATIDIDTEQPIDAARGQLQAFSSTRLAVAPPLGHSREMETVPTPPPWW